MTSDAPQPVRAFIALGSNLGDREQLIADALWALNQLDRVRVVATSSLHETEPVGPAGQDAYLNGAAELETTVSPRDLLNAMLAIERSLGRDRSEGERWGPRTIDLDLLLYGDLVTEEPSLTIPHPRLHERMFVLAPLAEIAPDATVATLGRTISELHDALRVRDSG